MRTVSLSPTSFLLEWDPPLEEDRNGVLTGYRLVLEWEVGQEYRVNTTHTSYNFTQLQQGTTYYCAVAAYTAIGTGPYYRTSLSTPNVKVSSPHTYPTQLKPSSVATTSNGIVNNNVNGSIILFVDMRQFISYAVGGGVGGNVVLLVLVIVITALLTSVICKRKRISTQ